MKKTYKVMARLHYSQQEIAIRMERDLHIDRPLKEIYENECVRFKVWKMPPLTFTLSQLRRLARFSKTHGADDYEFDYYEDFYRVY